MGKKLYWAADRKFNEVEVAKVRAAGYTVFLPQEAFSGDADPTNEEIFRIDTEELQSCDAVVACLDQFPIDSGVACEIGVAFGSNIPVIGLYTDIRSRRKGAGRMYKNQYVLGAIEAHGKIVYSIEEVYLNPNYKSSLSSAVLSLRLNPSGSSPSSFLRTIFQAAALFG